MSHSTVHIVQRMAPGGLEVLALELARNLPGFHLVVSLEQTASQLVRAWPRLNGLAGSLIGMGKKPGRDIHLINRLRALLRDFRAGSVITHHAGPFIYGGLAARLARVRRIVHVEHDVWHYRCKKHRRLMQATAMVVRPTIIGVSEKIRAILNGVYPGHNVRVIQNGVDLNRFVHNRSQARARLGLSLDAPIIGAVGRLEFVKGYDLLVEAVSLLPAGAVLVIAGDGSQRAALQDQARALGIVSRMHFLGHRDDVAELYAAFDVFCQPSREEGLPLAVLEAQACGVPVVATAAGDMPAAVCPRSGHIVPCGAVNSLSTTLAIALARAGGPSPRQFISDRFNWQNTLGGYGKVLGV
jgi:glycosyltransferase involved in cell wall biosynthesis